VLRSIRIRNFAIIEQLDLQFEEGMTALTGETGAGKSILIEALGLALGERADPSMLRSGTGRVEVEAVFDIRGNARAREQLGSLLDEVSLKRSIGAPSTAAPPRWSKSGMWLKR
jgi:DNA repair protein RecN (Recombination protein N)